MEEEKKKKYKRKKENSQPTKNQMIELSKKFPKQVDNYYPRLFCYSDCLKDKDGLIDAKRYLPKSFDIVYVEILRERKKYPKIMTAWWCGTGWEGAKIMPKDKILRWKRKEIQNEN